MARGPLIRGVVRTDATFTPSPSASGGGWLGKCLHCGTKLHVDAAGETDATIEHIVARTNGGTDALANLALACAACNMTKGRTHDVRASARSTEVVNALLAKRKERWREPDFDALLAREPAAVLDTPDEFIRWAAEHEAHRFLVAEAQAEVCAKPRELAARVLELIREEEEDA
jgi:hypothetical protein